MADKKDAIRYRWLKKQVRLLLKSSGEQWKNADGVTFVGSHFLCAGNTQYSPGKSLDEVVDNAMEINP